VTVRSWLTAVLAASAIAAAVAARQQPPPSRGEIIYREQCASCHDATDQPRTPARASLASRSLDVILASLAEGGSMALQGRALSQADRRAVAEFLSARSTATTDPATAGAGRCPPASSARFDYTAGASWNGWGNGVANTRFQPAAAAGLTAAEVPKLTLTWAFGYPGETTASAQPAIVGGRVFVGTERGLVYSLDASSGCIHWTFKPEAGVRSAMTVAPISGRGVTTDAVYFGDLRGSVYALDAASGTELWKVSVDSHPWARITGAPTLWNGRLYVPVSSAEEFPAARPEYPCCTFRGSLVAIDAASGKTIWQTFMIPEQPRSVGKNSAGTPLWEPAGVAIWASPTVDVAKNAIYVATGNAYTDPAAPTSDAIVALDLATGAIRWVRQVTPNDAFVVGCKPGNENCPDDVGPDFDFGNSAILRDRPGGGRILVVGQKSGVAYGLDPDREGAILWQFRAGQGGELGGIEWGSAADEQAMYVPVSDVLRKPEEAGGLFALRLATGERIWHTPAPPLKCLEAMTTAAPAASPQPRARMLGCTGAQSAAVTVIPGVVFSGSVDGRMRAYSTVDGTIIWDFDTARPFTTVNGVEASGGSIDGGGPVVAGGLLLTNSGYGRWRGKPGNVLLAFSAK
jgi:polyvinyl alcohol dehydrogenase (cytochrome)